MAPSSVLEARFVELIRDFGLPEPTRQHLPPWAVGEGIGRVDFAYTWAQVTGRASYVAENLRSALARSAA